MSFVLCSLVWCDGKRRGDGGGGETKTKDVVGVFLCFFCCPLAYLSLVKQACTSLLFVVVRHGRCFVLLWVWVFVLGRWVLALCACVRVSSRLPA